MIARHVEREDLPNYRLASKILADAGRPQQFHTIVLRSTLASWSAFKRVRGDEHLSRFVRTLIWDASAWRVGTDVRDWHEWTRHCESQAKHYALVNPKPDQAALYEELAGSRQLWEAYLSRLEEEKAVRQEIAADIVNRTPTPAWLELSNLRTIHVVKGAYQFNNRHIYRLHEHTKLPVASTLSAWRGDSFSQTPSAHMLLPIHSLTAAAPNTSKLRLDGLTVADNSFLTTQTYIRNSDLSSVKIRFGTSNHGRFSSTPPRYFHQYLDQWPNLESLTLDLHNRIPAGNNTTAALETIQNVFGVEGGSAVVTSALGSPLTWPRLRKLSLGHFNSTPKALISLINRHGSTLRDLRLHAIWIYDKIGWNDAVPTQYSWQEVFRSVGAATNLEKLKLSGLFRNGSQKDDDWDFDIGGLSEHVAAWIIKGEQHSQREELLLILRSYYGSHDQVTDSTEPEGQNGALNLAGK